MGQREEKEYMIVHESGRVDTEIGIRIPCLGQSPCATWNLLSTWHMWIIPWLGETGELVNYGQSPTKTTFNNFNINLVKRARISNYYISSLLM